MKLPRLSHEFLRIIMRITLLQMILGIALLNLCYAFPVDAQSVLDQPISLSVEEQEVSIVLSKLEKLANVKFTYLPQQIQASRKVTLNAINQRLAAVLAQLFENTSISIEVVNDRQIILRNSPPPVLKEDMTLEATVDRSITGTVKSESGEALPGVNVIVKNSNRGISTDGEGKFSLSIPDNAEYLLFSSIGYQTQEIPIGNRTSFEITMKAQNQSLDEVVVIGYGTVKKSDLTGSVAKIDETSIKATPIVALDRAMQGRMAGVQVTSNSAAPGGGTTIRIRGTGSVNAGNDPLYVIDGFPTGDLNSINPSDIESIEILKDASATAIYGSRGSNGVIMVTTKRGKAGQSTINFESYYGVQSVRRKIPLLNAREYADFINDARINAGGVAYFDGSSAAQPLPETLGKGTDWQDEVFQTAPIQNYQLSFTGGETKTKYAISGSYYDQQGIIINSYFKRFSLRANLDREVKPWLTIGLSMQGAHTRSNSSRTGAGTDGGANGGVTNAALNYAPVFPVYASSGVYYRDQSTLNGNLVDNPVGLAKEVTNLYYTIRLLSNFYADVKITPHLTFRTSWGADLLAAKQNYYATRLIQLGASSNGVASVSNTFNVNYLNENTLTYTRSFAGKHHLTALLGYTTQAYKIETVAANAVNFNDDFALYNNLGSGATLRNPSSGASDWALISYLARLNYGFDERFLFTLTARRDGSSRFGPNRKYGFFPSGAFAWRVINEQFLKNQKKLTDLKVRLSYGVAGNQGIGDYAYLSNIAITQGILGGANPSIQSGGVPAAISNYDLRWEKNTQLDAGLDVAFLDNRIRLTADYYRKITSDLLFSVNVPQTTGYSSILQNIGKVENKGWEFAISTVNIDTKDFKWNTDFNISFNKNQVLTLDGRPEFTTGTGSDHLQVYNTILLRVGEPLGSFYGRVTDGLFQTQEEVNNSAQTTASPGDLKYKDLNGDGVINDLDRTIIGNGYPKFFGGINNTLTYKGIDLTFFFQGSYGNSILNYGRFDLYNLNGNNNQSKEVLNRWTPTNTNTDIPRANAAGGQRILSTFHIEDGSYLRLKNISLGYTLSNAITQKWKLQQVKVYVSAQNWLTFTAYKGYDPEVNYAGNSAVSQGMDYGSYPTAKTLLVGLNVKF
ncbi:MAG: TonB-dependent receptor [Siphonobacter sp.]